VVERTHAPFHSRKSLRHIDPIENQPGNSAREPFVNRSSDERLGAFLSLATLRRCFGSFGTNFLRVLRKTADFHASEGYQFTHKQGIFAVRQSTKRVRVTEPLEAVEFRALMLELPQKMRVIGIMAATTGLRISEVLGLKWMDIDWKALQMEVTRSVVDGVVGKCKTETTRRPVPIDKFTSGELLAWKCETCYAALDDWVFASERVQGRMPPWADTLLDRFLQPAAKRAGIMKWVGFHTFRHTYSTLLKANGEDVKVVQELMRHANISTTMNIYTKALTPAKREAQSRVVDVLLDRSRKAPERAA
jgi:integrase